MDGQYVVKVAQRKAGDPIVATWSLYDAGGRLTDVWLPAVTDDDLRSPTHGQSVSPHWAYRYDANGNETRQTDPKGHVTSFGYDDQNRRTSRTLPAVAGATVTETWTYDAYGRSLTHTDFDGQTTAWVYDNGTSHGGRLTDEYRFVTGMTAVDGNGTVLTANAAERTAYGYDALGRRATVDEYAGTTLTRHSAYGYDPVTGGLTLSDTPEGVIHHSYDPATGRLTRTWTAADDTTYEYDALGRLDHVIATELAGQAVNLVTDYGYDGDGDLHATTEENGVGSADDVVTTYGYDLLNRLTDELVKRGGTATLFSQHVVIGDDGQKQSVLEQTADGQTVFTKWSYDADGRLTKETRDVGNDGLVTVAGDYVDGYKYDLAGNRVLATVDKPGTADDVNTTSAYDERDRLTASGPDTDGDGVPDAGAATTTSYGYDVDGSQTSETTNGATKRYVWDLRGRLVGLDANGDGDTLDAGDATYTYDADGVRVGSAVVGGDTTTYLQDGANPTGYSQVLEETTTPATGPLARRSYVLGPTILAQSDGTAASTRSLLTDGGGSTRALLDATGQVATGQVYAYDAFGTQIADLANPIVLGTRLLYRGQFWDETLGQYQLRARYYDPATGRFDSQDLTIFGSEDFGNANLYAYASGNPLRFSDPSGRFSLAELAATGTVRDILDAGMGRIQQAANVYFRVRRFVDFAEEAKSIFDLVYSGELTNILWEQVKQVPLGGGYQGVNQFFNFTADEALHSLERASVRIAEWTPAWLSEMLRFGSNQTLKDLFISFPIPIGGLIFNPSIQLTTLHIGSYDLPLKLKFGKTNNNFGLSLFGFGMDTQRQGSQATHARQMFRFDIGSLAPSHPNFKTDEWDGWSDAPFHYHVFPLFPERSLH